MPSLPDNDWKDEDIDRSPDSIESTEVLYAAQPKNGHDFRVTHHKIRFTETTVSEFNQSFSSPFLSMTYQGEIPILSSAWTMAKDDKFGDDREEACQTLPFPEDEIKEEKKTAADDKDDTDDFYDRKLSFDDQKEDFDFRGRSRRDSDDSDRDYK